MKKSLLIAILLITAISSASNAQMLKLTSGQWKVLTLENAGKTTCYIASSPTNSTGTFKKRGEPFVMVTSRGATDEISASSGYPYKQATDVALTINGKATALFAENDRAWAKDSATDAALVKAMMQGNTMSVKGFSRLGSNSVDNYSLNGFTYAYRKMKELCK